MPERLTPDERSRLMSRVKTRNTKPERSVRKLLSALGYRYRLHSKLLPGKPDIVFNRLKKAIFVHGCFWHGHQGCPRGKRPSSRQDFWYPKLDKNAERDAATLSELESRGWSTLVIWECEVRNTEALQEKLSQFLATQGSHEDRPQTK